MTKDEALKRGMELLRSNISAQQWFELQPEITAIKDALAQPEQEPVAIVIKSGVNRTWMSEALGQLPDGTYSLYTTPPAQREWVELTDDDLVACSEAQKATVIYFLAKLKKKNT